MKRLFYIWLCTALAVLGIAMAESSQPTVTSPREGLAMAHADSDTVQIEIDDGTVFWWPDLFWWLRKEPW